MCDWITADSNPPYPHYNVKPGDTTPAYVFVGVLPVVDYPLKSRYFSYHLPSSNEGTGSIAVELVSLLHPARPYGGPYQPADFTGLEGQTRWLGPPTVYRMSDTDANHLFYASRLQCEPWVGDWSGVSSVNVYGAEVVPDSVYQIDYFGQPDLYYTGRWTDVVPPFEQDIPGSQPNFTDVGAMVDRFRNAFIAASKAQTQLQPATPNPAIKVNFSDISQAVDAFRGYAYPFAAPDPCP